MLPLMQFDCESVFGLAGACRAASTELNLRGRKVEDVYLYWISKRRRLGKSLMRIFEVPASRRFLVFQADPCCRSPHRTMILLLTSRSERGRIFEEYQRGM
jgi:hypothetical protein